ncbi:MAG: CHAP domain-containing protein [Candidatus Gastranaerophilales bacterium]|nr:CHAP domain-containing protein [Candidatus Gastranaerophilales bacterium]
MYDGGEWWDEAVASGYYETGQTPQLGAVICFDLPGESGHVGIVEEIDEQTGEITVSNSAYQGTFFFLSYITPVNGRYDWNGYNFQGFIYNPYADQPTPPTPGGDVYRSHFPWVLYARKLRKKRRF